MNQQQQQWRISRERGYAYLDQQRKDDERRRRGMDGTPYIPMHRSVLGSFFKGLFVTLLTLATIAALAFGGFVILNRLGVFN
jgi:hypothetical protein